MKNSIKIITTFGIVAFFPVYPMALSDFREDMIDPAGLTNPFLGTNGFCTRTNIQDSWQSTPDDDPLHTDEGLVLILTAVKILAEKDEKKNEKLLVKVCNAIRTGKPVTSKYATQSGEVLLFVSIFPSKNPTSIFTSTEGLFEHPPRFTNTDDRKVDKKRLWMNAVFQGHRERQEEFDRMCKKSIDWVCNGKLKIEIPKVLMPLIFSCLPAYHVNRESTKLIEQVKQKIDEE